MLISLSLYMVKHYWSFCYHQHIHLMSVVEVKTQTRFMVVFPSRPLVTWGKPLDALPGISPRYLPAIYSQLTISPFLLQTYTMTEYAFFLTKSRPMEKRDGSNVGGHQHLPFAAMVSNTFLSQAELFSLNGLRTWGRGRNSTMTSPSCWY